MRSACGRTLAMRCGQRSPEPRSANQTRPAIGASTIAPAISAATSEPPDAGTGPAREQRRPACVQAARASVTATRPPHISRSKPTLSTSSLASWRCAADLRAAAAGRSSASPSAAMIGSTSAPASDRIFEIGARRRSPAPRARRGYSSSFTALSRFGAFFATAAPLMLTCVPSAVGEGRQDDLDRVAPCSCSGAALAGAHQADIVGIGDADVADVGEDVARHVAVAAAGGAGEICLEPGQERLGLLRRRPWRSSRANSEVL